RSPHCRLGSYRASSAPPPPSNHSRSHSSLRDRLLQQPRWLASALGLGLSRLNSHADSSVDERQQSAMDNQYDIDGGGLPKTRLSELLIRESWVRIPPGPPRFRIENWATGRVQTPPT